jgi:hypothetical protein
MKQLFTLILITLSLQGLLAQQSGVDSMQIETELNYHSLPLNDFDTTYYMDLTINHIDTALGTLSILYESSSGLDSTEYQVNLDHINNNPDSTSFISGDTLHYRLDSLNTLKFRTVLKLSPGISREFFNNIE